MKNSERWPYIGANCHYRGSRDYYLADEYERARKVNAPRDTYACGHTLEHGIKPHLLRDATIEHRERMEKIAGVSLDELLDKGI